MRNQTTLARSVQTSGVGLHTGSPVTITLMPAPAYTGYLFRRTDLSNFEILAQAQNVAHVSYATTLMHKGVMIATVEHLLAALAGAGVDNAFIDIDSLEVPIMDGSAEPFVDLIKEAGIVELTEPRQALRVTRRVEIKESNKRISISPADRLYIDCLIDFPHPVIGVQRFQLAVTERTFVKEIAPARTFGFLREVEMLRSNGLIRGGSMESAVVMDDDRVLNREGLRFPDEFVRHKILDIIGDLSLFGMPVLGRIEAERTGHALHTALVAKLLRDRTAWKIVTLSEECAAGSQL